LFPCVDHIVIELSIRVISAVAGDAGERDVE